jgi:hypothetical protein
MYFIMETSVTKGRAQASDRNYRIKILFIYFLAVLRIRDILGADPDLDPRIRTSGYWIRTSGYWIRTSGY